MGTGIKVVDRQTNKLITKRAVDPESRTRGEKKTTQTNVIESKAAGAPAIAPATYTSPTTEAGR